jgi:3-carboxy-cis,cis-muconate cycloisomerase
LTVSPFDHPVLSGLLGDEEVSRHFSVKAELAAMLEFEVALARAEAETGVIPVEAGTAIVDRLRRFSPDIKALRDGVTQDGVLVPELVRQLRSAVGEPWSSHVHFGATSQDVIDTGLALRMGKVLEVLESSLDGVIAELDSVDQRDGSIETMSHTRMQAAIAVPAARKIASWRDPLVRHRERLPEVRAQICCVTLGGAAGTLEKLGANGDKVTARVAQILSLNPVPRARHSERDAMAALASWLSLVTGSLGKMGQDIALLAQSELGEIRLASGGGSSAMPHKVNPVSAEVLVTLARFNATLVSGMHQSLVHENERSGAAWTLEWMLLPQMIVASACALRTAKRLLTSVSFATSRA